MTLAAQQMISITKLFSENDFDYIVDNDTTWVSSLKLSSFYLDDTSLPALPYLGMNVLIPPGAQVDSVTYSCSNSSICHECIIPHNPQIRPNSMQYVSIADSCIANDCEDRAIYNNINYTVNEAGGYRFVSLSYTPFTYVESQHVLKLSEEVSFTIYTSHELERLPNVNKSRQNQLCNFIINPEGCATWYDNAPISSSSGSTVDFLIVTNENLKPRFKKLALWRSLSGLNTIVETTENIAINYSGVDIQSKIKNCIGDYYNNHGLKYVLLGGDASIIPPRYCKLESSDVNVVSAPIDSYYACFGDDLSWDRNGNGIFGEIADSIKLSPDIAIGRLPLASSIDVRNYINGLKYYEQGDMDICSNRFLFNGCQVHSSMYDALTDQEVSDTHYRGNKIYRQFDPYGSSTEYKYLYDTGNNLRPSMSIYSQGLMEALADGYSIVFENSHGTSSQWTDENRVFFDYYEAQCACGEGVPVIVAGCCDSANFTDADCIGRHFLNNRNLNNLAYWGNTSLSWGPLNIHGMGLTDNLFKDFLDILYKSKCLRIGDVINGAKCRNLFETRFEKDRWGMLVSTLLGDPTLELHTDKLLPMKPVSIHILGDSYTIIPQTPDCVLSVVNNDSILIQSNDSVTLPIDLNYTDFYITKQGYSPIYLQSPDFEKMILEQHNITSSITINANDVEMKEVTLLPNSKLNLNVKKSISVKGLNIQQGSQLNINRKR